MGGRVGVVLASIPLAILLVVVVARPLVWEDDGWTKYEQVKAGMTRQQVEAVMGGPASAETPQGSAWAVRGGRVIVAFDDQGRVVESSFLHGGARHTP